MHVVMDMLTPFYFVNERFSVVTQVRLFKTCLSALRETWDGLDVLLNTHINFHIFHVS